MPAAFTQATFKNKVKENRPNAEVLGNYIDAYTPIRFRCRVHNLEFLLGPYKLLHQSDCNAHVGERCRHWMKAAAIRTVDDVIESVHRIHGNTIEVESLATPRAKLHLKCTLCDHSWVSTQSNTITHGKGCAQCRNANLSERFLKSETEFKQILHARTNGTVELIGPYTGAKSVKEFHCIKCDYRWKNAGLGKCQSCGCRKRMKSGLTSKAYKLGRRTVTVQGFEHHALDILINKGVSPKNITVDSEDKIPMIEYDFQGILRKHFPDICVTRPDGSKVIIEVKSAYTLGLLAGTWEHYWASNKAKIRSAIQQGIDYRVMLIEKGRHVPLPRNWFDMPRPKLIKLLDLKKDSFSTGDIPS